LLTLLDLPLRISQKRLSIKYLTAFNGPDYAALAFTIRAVVGEATAIQHLEIVPMGMGTSELRGRAMVCAFAMLSSNTVLNTPARRIIFILVSIFLFRKQRPATASVASAANALATFIHELRRTMRQVSWEKRNCGQPSGPPIGWRSEIPLDCIKYIIRCTPSAPMGQI